MSPVFISFSIAFAGCITLLPFIIRYAKRKNLYDEPSRRRIHKKITPSMGGIGIFFGLVTSLIILAETRGRLYFFELITILTIPFVVGLLDDLIHLTPKTKLLGQAFTAVFIFYVLDTRITSFYGLLPLDTLNHFLSLPLTFAVIVVITNAFNLIDGIDGLAASVAIIIFGFLGVWFYAAGALHLSVVAFGAGGAIMAFLIRNWAPSRIFMGDTGSLVIGTLIAILIFNFLSLNYNLSDDSALKFGSSVGAALAILVIPFTDTVRVIVVRLSKGISPIKADKRHIHHVLVRLGKSHPFAVYTICAVQLLFLLLAILFRAASDWQMLAIVFATSITFCLVLDKVFVPFFKKRKNQKNTQLTAKTTISDPL
jgi:UDP-GlcNAc:undecaprenyl-phosphate/decaprenyl-phosphate GlcNAc-1-phosphate transferase